MTASLLTIANEILIQDKNDWIGKRQVENLVKYNPLVKFVMVSYTYTELLGSDYCWDASREGTCTLRDWLRGMSYGNRCINFRITGVVDADETACAQRKQEHDAKIAAERQAEIDARAEETSKKEAKQQKLQDQMTSFTVGMKVSVKGVCGRIKKVMVSRFNADKVCALIDFHDGHSKWHGLGIVKKHQDPSMVDKIVAQCGK
jgi:hypothetical protein